MSPVTNQLKMYTKKQTIMRNPKFLNLLSVLAECVGEICSCKHVHNLPHTFVETKLESRTLKIYWNITAPTPELLVSAIHVDSIDIR